MAALLRILAARFREMLLARARPYGGVPGGDGARRGMGGGARGRGAGRSGSPGPRGGSPRGQRGHGEDGSEVAGDHGQSYWSGVRDTLRRTRSSRPDVNPSLIEVVKDVKDAVEIIEAPGRIYELGTKVHSYLVRAGISVGSTALYIKGKFQAIKESVKDHLSPSKLRLPRDEACGKPNDSRAPGPLDFSM